MLIGKNYKIESDALNVTLFHKVKRHKKGTGEAYDGWEVDGYFATVNHALKELVNQEVSKTQLTDLKTVVEKINEVYKLIDTFAKTSTINEDKS